MPLVPDPCLVEKIKANNGATRLLVQVANGPEAFNSKITGLNKPNWVDVEGYHLGATMAVKPSARLPMILNINTGHVQFPKDESSYKDELTFEFENGEQLVIYLYLREITNVKETFRGTLAMDFGTTNSCYAWKGRVGSDFQMSDMLTPPKASSEIPSVIRLKDISLRKSPTVEVGHPARDYISKNSGRSYTYAISIKRLLGEAAKTIFLDERSGIEPDRFQEYLPEEIAGLIIKEILVEAEREIGMEIPQVVATYPILFTQTKLNALRRAFKFAFESMDKVWSDESVILKVDETNAATFNYIYGTILDEMRRFSSASSKHRLVSYDFGGGTVDVAVTDVDLERDSAGRVIIKTTPMGLTGDAYFGGDNVTLATLMVLKHKLVLTIAETITEEKQAAAAAAEAEATEEEKTDDDPWSFSAEPEEQKSTWGAPVEEVEEETPEVEEEVAPEDPETADIFNANSPDDIDRAVEVVTRCKDCFEYAAATGTSPTAALAALVQNGSKTDVLPHEVGELSKQLEQAIDVLVPTRWKTMEDRGDLIGKDIAHKLFYELWLPAEMMKIKSVTAPDRTATLTFPLKKIAHYNGLRPESFMQVTITEAEVNAAIEIPLRRSMSKAAYLLQHAEAVEATPGEADSGAGGLDFGFGDMTSDSGTGSTGGDARPITVLLAGNSARLPVVRQMAEELFGVPPDKIVMDAGGVKASVAQGACEEHILRRDFGGSGGLIQYQSADFVSALPFSVGFFQPELELVGYEGGFAPVLPRGTAVNTSLVVTNNLPVIHRNMTELPVFAWYHDHPVGTDATNSEHIPGVQLKNLGWFDLTKTVEKPADVSLSEAVVAEYSAHMDSKPPEGEENDEKSKPLAYVMHVDQKQNIWLTDPATDRWFGMNALPDQCTDDENPFSGTH
jgi:molecular chaperone DnaK (HSP70)